MKIEKLLVAVKGLRGREFRNLLNILSIFAVVFVLLIWFGGFLGHKYGGLLQCTIKRMCEAIL